MTGRACVIALALAVALALAGAAPAAARGPAVDVLVVGKAGERLLQAADVRPSSPKIKVGGRTCRVGEDTPLGALIAAADRIRLRARDEGTCGKRTRDAGTIYVTGVGRDRAKGREGWVYKVGRKAGTTAAADLSGPFGTGRRLRAGDRVTWFWCVLGPSDLCQRTLAVKAVASGPGQVTATVKGYDDNGKGVATKDALVQVAPSAAGDVVEGRTDASGRAVISVTDAVGATVIASKDGLVPSFEEAVEVG